MPFPLEQLGTGAVDVYLGGKSQHSKGLHEPNGWVRRPGNTCDESTESVCKLCNGSGIGSEPPNAEALDWLKPGELEALKGAPNPPLTPNADDDWPKGAAADWAPKAGVDEPKGLLPKTPPPCPNAGVEDPKGDAALDAPNVVDPNAGWLIPNPGVLCKQIQQSEWLPL